MSFDSPAFLFFFLPLLLVLEALVRPVKAKNALLCCAGLVFYSFGELWATALLVVSAFVNWLLGLLAVIFVIIGVMGMIERGRQTASNASSASQTAPSGGRRSSAMSPASSRASGASRSMAASRCRCPAP